MCIAECLYTWYVVFFLEGSTSTLKRLPNAALLYADLFFLECPENCASLY